MLGPFATASRRTPIHQVSLLSPLSHATCASMSTTTPTTPTTTTTTTTTRDRGDRYGPIEWAQQKKFYVSQFHILIHSVCSRMKCSHWSAAESIIYSPASNNKKLNRC